MIKQFDAELGWVSRMSKIELANFWRESPARRLEIVKQARGGGGTVTPQVDRELSKFEEEGSRYTRVERMEVSEAQWIPDSCVCIDGSGANIEPAHEEPQCRDRSVLDSRDTTSARLLRWTPPHFVGQAGP